MGIVKTTTNSDGSTTTSKLRFSYDANGKVVAVNYNGNYYYYLRNAQSDIVKLIDKTGETVVEYRYDSWGKLLSTSGSLASTLGKNNPFRYRGYGLRDLRLSCLLSGSSFTVGWSRTLLMLS